MNPDQLILRVFHLASHPLVEQVISKKVAGLEVVLSWRLGSFFLQFARLPSWW
jgi:hypothetical protein